MKWKKRCPDGATMCPTQLVDLRNNSAMAHMRRWTRDARTSPFENRGAYQFPADSYALRE